MIPTTANHRFEVLLVFGNVIEALLLFCVGSIGFVLSEPGSARISVVVLLIDESFLAFTRAGPPSR